MRMGAVHLVKNRYVLSRCRQNTRRLSGFVAAREAAKNNQNQPASNIAGSETGPRDSAGKIDA